MKLDVLLLQNLTHIYQSAQTLSSSYNNCTQFQNHDPSSWPWALMCERKCWWLGSLHGGGLLVEHSGCINSLYTAQKPNSRWSIFGSALWGENRAKTSVSRLISRSSKLLCNSFPLLQSLVLQWFMWNKQNTDAAVWQCHLTHHLLNSHRPKTLRQLFHCWCHLMFATRTSHQKVEWDINVVETPSKGLAHKKREWLGYLVSMTKVTNPFYSSSWTVYSNINKALMG